MRRGIPAALLLIASVSPSAAEYWGCASSGLDMSILDWEHGGQLSWSFLAAFGPRLFDEVYLRARISIPATFLVVIGNQVSLGGEVSYLPVWPKTGLAVETSVGASWCLMWPRHVTVILADGETSGPAPQYSFEGAHGLRLQAVLSVGYRFDCAALWLDLGADHRIMNVRRTVQGEAVDEDFTFTGPHLGASVDFYL